MTPLAKPQWLNAQTPPHIFTLVLVTGIAALNMNMILPSLPGIATYFGVDYSVAQIAISGYFALTAVLQFILGPLSDRYGRRPVILVSLALFLLATIGCALASSFAMLLAFRLMQASIASCIALSRATVRDMVEPDQAASMLGYVTMGMAVAPMVGPLMGGLLDEWFGWRAIFAFTFCAGLTVLIVAFRDYGETNQQKSASLTAQFRAYPELVKSRRFWGYSLTAAFCSGAFFAFLGGGPYVSLTILGLSPARMGLYFSCIALGYMAGNFLAGRYSMRLGMNRMMLIGAVVSTAAPLISLVLFASGLVHPLSFFLPMAMLGLGNGMVMPNASAGIVSVRPHLAGSASGLGNALMIGGGAVLSAFAASRLGPGHGAEPLIILMALCSGLATLAVWDVIRTARRKGDLGQPGGGA